MFNYIKQIGLQTNDANLSAFWEDATDIRSNLLKY